MKITLFNDLSSLQLNLRDGLRELGHEVKLIANGDRHKNIACDIKLDLTGKGAWQKTVERSRLLPLFFKADVLQLVNPGFLFSNTRMSVSLLRGIKAASGTKLFSVLALENPETWAYYRKGGYTVSPHQGMLCDQAINGEPNMDEHPVIRQRFNAIVNTLDGLLAGACEYAFPFLNHPKYKGAIPFPINTTKFSAFPNDSGKGKICFFHGIQSSRKGFKGTAYVLAAMESLRSRYANDVELITVQDIPYTDYFAAVNRAHVVVDQTNSYSPGMNALIAMAKGKFVLTGAEEEYKNFWGFSEVPFLNIEPTADDVYKKMVWVLENRHRLKDISHQCAQFVQQHHSHITVAQQYVDKWKA